MAGLRSPRSDPRRRIAAALLGLACLLAPPAQARDESPWRQQADLVFHPVARSTETPNALVPTAIAEGSDGYIWLAGGAGLVRWDGYAFHTYPAEPGRPGGLQETNITGLTRDSAGRVWVVTYAGELARYDQAGERLQAITLPPGRCTGQHLWMLADDGQGGLFLGCRGGLVRLDANGAAVTDPARIAGQPAATPDVDVFAILRDHKGELWAATHHGLWRSTDEAHSWREFTGLPERNVSMDILTEDSLGQIWVGTGHRGAFVVSADRTAARRIAATTPPAGAGDEAISINAVLEISPGVIWIGTDGNGIIEADAATLQTRLIQHDPFVPDGPSCNSVQALYRDRAGLVWVATTTGISTFDPASAGIMTLFGDARRGTGLPTDNVLAVRATADGAVWIGQQAGGFTIMDPRGRRASGLAGQRVYAIAPAPAPAPDGEMLLATGHGLFRADAKGQVLGRVAIPGLADTAPVSVLATIGDTVWLSSLESGVWAVGMDGHGGTVARHRLAAEALTDTVAEAIAPAPDGAIAIGADEGFNLVDPARGSIEQVLPGTAPDALPHGMTAAFVTDRLGRLWVGTGNGLCLMRGGAGQRRFQCLGTAEGLPNQAIESLALDRHGNIWAGTDQGLAVIDPVPLTVRALGRADGLAITAYWGGAVALLADGELAFGGNGGLTIMQPDAVRSWSYRPPVVVTAARVGGAAVQHMLGDGGVITVPPSAKTLAVEFAALDYSAPAQNRYAFRLDGFDPDWTEVDAGHRVANYTNLPPGAYHLRLRGSNRVGTWSSTPTTLRIEVLPAWWQTWWFRTAVITLAGLATMAVGRRWTAGLRQRQRELERQVALRTSQLCESQHQLQNANTDLERRVAERTQALAASEARFRAWFDQAEDAMFVVQRQADGGFVYEAMNAAASRIFGIDPAKAPGHSPVDILPADYVANELAQFRAAMQGEPLHYQSTLHMPAGHVPAGQRDAGPGDAGAGEAGTGEARTGEARAGEAGPDGAGQHEAGQHEAGATEVGQGRAGDRLIDTWLVPLRNEATGQVERLVGAARDLTERRALEARLAQAEKLQALGALAGGIAHDFNNILQAVSGAAMLMERRPGDQGRVVSLARSTITAAERGTSITKRLLAFARNDALRVEALPSEDVLAGIAEVLKFTLGGAISVVTEFAADLPPILADRGQLETAIVNLGTNARDAMPAGGTLVLAATGEAIGDPSHPSGLPPGAYVRIDVTDSGQGMDELTLARAMEPFFTTKEKGHGTGLGLPQVKGFTEQSGGQMVIVSRPGRGTTVSLWLRAATQAALRGGGPAADMARPALSRGTVLVVDDDLLVRETLAEQLDYAGFTVTQAEGGVQALQLLQAGLRPQVMVCDLSMPGMDGVQTIAAARDIWPALRCFLLTGYAGDRVSLDGRAGFTLLRKPITADALIASIEGVLMQAAE